MLTSLKELQTEEGSRKYYRYNMRDASTLVHHVEPFLDPSYNEQLLEMFGTDVHGDPKLRIAWAGTLRALAFKDMGDHVVEYSGMKYPYMRIVVDDGYEFEREGKRVVVAKLEDVPDNVPFGVRKRYDELGKMLFVVEMKFTAEELVSTGYYPPFDSPEFESWRVKDGKRFGEKPNPQGEYRFCNFIMTPEGEYREVVPADIDNIRQILNRAQNETEMEYVTRKREQLDKIAALTKQQESNRFDAILPQSIVRAQNKLAKGKIIYGV